MSNTIKIKRGSGIPASLVEGELAIDTSTGLLYSLVAGVVTELNEPPDLSNYIDSTKRNDVVEGTFQILWDDSADPTYPFNGRIGYNKAVADPNALDGSFLYVSGTRGTFSIGRDGDLELHGASEIQGIPNNSDERPWITGFSYVQAADFLDVDGNSIKGANVKISADVPTDFSNEGDLWYCTSDKGLYCFDGQFWFELTDRPTPPDTVLSVNGKVGSVVVSASDVGAVPASTMVAAFATLKEAITEEDTVEGLRSAVIDGLDAVISKLLSEVNHNE